MKDIILWGANAGRHQLVEQAALLARDDFNNAEYVGLMAGSAAGVWAVAGGIWYLSSQKKAEAEAKPLVEESPESAESSEGAVGVSSLSLLLSIPALFAHWCWPVVFGMILGGAAEFFTPKARAIGHAMFWGLNFGLFMVMSVYIYLKTIKKEQEDLAMKWAPMALVVTGAMLVMVDLTRHVLLDLELAGAALAMYNDAGGLTVVGIIGVTCTWLGVACVFTGIALFADLPSKVIKAWNSAVEEKQPAQP